MVIDLWKITLRAGANSLAATCNILAGVSLGPVNLFVFNFSCFLFLCVHFCVPYKICHAWLGFCVFYEY